MPTTRPRHQVTETAKIAAALDAATRRWPAESRSRLLHRLIGIGSEHLLDDADRVAEDRRRAVRASSGKYADAFPADYLTTLREDWPA